MKVFTVIVIDSEGTKDDPIIFESRNDAETCAQFICNNYIADRHNNEYLKISNKPEYWEIVDTQDDVETLEIRVVLTEEQVIKAGDYSKIY